MHAWGACDPSPILGTPTKERNISILSSPIHMEELKRIGDVQTCSSAFFIKKGKILLGLRHYTKDKWKVISVWTTPGGRCDDGEILGDNLRRETKEETGITNFTVRQYLGSYSGAKEGDTVHVFLAETEEEPQLMEPEKFSEWRWFPIKDLPESLISPHVKKILAVLLIAGR